MAGVERCVMCNDVIPEGRQVCPNCEKKVVNSIVEAMEIVMCKRCIRYEIGCAPYQIIECSRYFIRKFKEADMV